MTRGRALAWLGAGAGILVLAVAARTSVDPDLWGHVRFGLDLLRSHHLTAADPYSFTQDRPWVNHEWLSELLMGLAYAAGRSAGLALLKSALACAALMVVWTALRGAEFGARLAAAGLVVIGAAQIVQTLRPQLWTLLALAILCRALVSGRPRAHAWLPLVFLVWANAHGGWIVGLGVLGVWAAADAVMSPRAASRWAIIVAGSALATLGTPYGLGLWRFLAESVRTTRPMIEEWQPLWLLPAAKWIPWLIAGGATVWLAWRPPARRLGTVAVLVLLGFASLRVARIVPLFVEVAGILLAPVIVSRWPSRHGQSDEPLSPSERPLVPLGLAAALAGAVWIGSSSLACVAVPADPRMPDVAAARALDAASAGRLVTFFNWGEYAIWHWGPALRVSMDGRRETVYSDERLAEHDAILFGTPEGLSVLERWRPEYVWMPATSAMTREWLSAHGYRIDVNTPRSFVAVRDDLPRLASSTAATPRPCFPQ